LRGSAFGLYHLTVGLGAFPASLLFGMIWQKFGPAAAFGFGAGLAFLAGVLLMSLAAPKKIE
jgi:MFS-type transporter involved in bile tolerance (Atg22 family)